MTGGSICLEACYISDLWSILRPSLRRYMIQENIRRPKVGTLLIADCADHKHNM